MDELEKELGRVKLKMYAGQKVPQYALGGGQTAVDVYETKIREILNNHGLGLEDAKEILSGIEAPHRDEMLSALSRIK